MMLTVRPLTIDGTFINHKGHREYILDEKIRKMQMLMEREKSKEKEEALKANTVEGMLLEF